MCPQQVTSIMTKEENIKKWSEDTEIPIPIMLYMHAARTSASDIRGVRRNVLLRAIESTAQAHYKLEKSIHSMHELLNYDVMLNSEKCVAKEVQKAINI